jgi:hypothetical protein
MPEPPAASTAPGRSRRSQLFTVRVWLEELGEGRSEWRGKVQHVLSGEARYFRDWQTLAAFIVERAAAAHGDDLHAARIRMENGQGLR